MLAYIRAFLWRILHMTRRAKSQVTLETELEFHLQMETEQNKREGFDSAEARRRALIALGGLQQTKEMYLEVRRFRWVHDFWQDLLYASRSMQKNLRFAFIAIITFAVSIGATTIIFSIIDGALFRPLPYKDPDRIVRIMNREPKTGLRSTIMPKDALNRFREAQTFESVAASNVRQWPTFLTLSGRDSAEMLRGAQVTSGYLQLLGVQPLLGRDFLPDDAEASAPVAILTHELWRRSFSSDRAIIGKTITFKEESLTIIGVLPPEFRFPAETPSEGAAILLPFPAQWTLPYCTLLGRMKPGVSLSQAQAEAQVINSRVLFEKMASQQVFISPLNRIEWINRTTLLSLFGAVVFLVLIACANVANLQIACGFARRREFAIRAAIGGGRLRLLRQLLTESLVLSSVGALAGVLLAYSTLDLVLTRLPVLFRPMAIDVLIDHRVLAFSAILSFIVGILSGIIPALQVSATNLNEALRQAEQRTFHIGGRRIRGLLIAVEAGLAMVLLIGSGLLLNSFMHLQRINLGYDPTLVRTATPIGLRNVSSERLAQLCDETVERLRAVPGVESAAVVGSLPLSLPGRDSIDERTSRVSSGYFETLGVPLLSGRPFIQQDEQSSATVAVINQSMAKRSFPGQNAIGRTLTIEKKSIVPVIGIVPDVRELDLRTPAKPTVYLPYGRASKGSNRYIVFRVAPGNNELSAQIKTILNSSQPFRVTKLADELGDSISSPRFFTLVVGFFAVIGLVLTAVGIGGITAQSVARRRHEIGVRLALGAKKTQVVAMVVRQVIMPVIIGLGFGIAGALTLTHILAGLLYEVKPTDPVTFVLISVIALITAFLSSYFPGLRAAKIDPVIMLRCD